MTNYLQDIAPELCDRVELHRKNVPLFDDFNIEEEINNILNKRLGNLGSSLLCVILISVVLSSTSSFCRLAFSSLNCIYLDICMVL